MSRHRNMKLWIEEDYYDDDDYDDYDDYDDHVAPVKKPTPKKQPPKKQQPTPKNQQQQQQKQQTSNKKKPSASTAAKAAATTTSTPATPATNQAASTTTSTPTQTPPPSTKPPPPPASLLSSNAQQRPHVTLVVLGHVDAGKSTVSGHLLHGPAQSHYKNTNFAWLLDEDEQERQHGNTMDIGTKQFTTTKYQTVLQDAPGHAEYVPATITGIANADAAILCVDSTDVNIDKGQLREHVYLAKGLGIHQMVVLLNKFDLLGWDNQALYRQKETILRNFLLKVGYPPHKVQVLPVSGLDGTNMFAKETPKNSDNDNPSQALWLWYQGPTLLEALDNLEAPPQQKWLEKPLRLVVTDVQESSSSNAVSIRAKCVSGWVGTSEAVVVLPLGDTGMVQKLTSLHHNKRPHGAAGEVLELTLQNIDAQRITTGSILARPGQLPPLSNQCRARIYILDVNIPLIRGAQVIFHMHSLDVPCVLTQLLRTLESDGSTKRKYPRALTKHTNAIVELQLASRLAMEAFADCRPLGRFVLRRSGDSVAVGRIEEVL